MTQSYLKFELSFCPTVRTQTRSSSTGSDLLGGDIREGEGGQLERAFDLVPAGISEYLVPPSPSYPVHEPRIQRVGFLVPQRFVVVRLSQPSIVVLLVIVVVIPHDVLRDRCVIPYLRLQHCLIQRIISPVAENLLGYFETVLWKNQRCKIIGGG